MEQKAQRSQWSLRAQRLRECGQRGICRRPGTGAARRTHKTSGRPPGRSSQVSPPGSYPQPFRDGSGLLCALSATGTRAVPSLIGQSLGLRHQEPDHCPQPAPRASLHFASAVACEPGTYFSGESSQCVPCTPGSYQDGEGQLSCTPCPSSDGLGLAGARNVSECGGECGHSWGEAQPGRDGAGMGWGQGGDRAPPVSTETPKQRPGAR